MEELMRSSSGNKRVNLMKLACTAVASAIIASKPIRRIALTSTVSDTDEQYPLSKDESSSENLTRNGSYFNNITSSPISKSNLTESSTTTTTTTTSTTCSDRSIGKNARLKRDGTIVTDADGASQRIIVENLRHISRDIRIVGEESKEDVDNGKNRLVEGEQVFDDDLLNEISHELHSRIPQNENELESEPERVSVIIDPLDGTKNYANGKYDSVTVLIAIILDNIPFFGVICKPFGQQYTSETSNNNSPLKYPLIRGCFVVYGGQLLNGAYIAGGGQCKPQHSSIYKAVISKSRSAGIVEKCIEKLHTRGFIDKDPLYISGAGEKTLRLIIGTNNESLWFFPKPGTSLWDVAAADALLSAIGGKLTDKYGNVIDYSKSRNDADNKKGVVACNNLHLHEQCIQTFNEGGWLEDD